MDERLSAPLSATINVTESCNLACSYCYARTSTEAAHMPADEAVALVRQLDAMGVWRLVVGGGEPFLHPQIIPILSRILESGIQISVVSNGLPIRGHYAELVGLFRFHGDRLNLQISLDGPTPEIHDRTRGHGEEVFEIVERLLADGVPLQLATVVTRHNVDRAHEIVDLFYPRVRQFHFMNLMPSRKLLLEAPDLWADPEELDRLWDRLRGRAKALEGLLISMPGCGSEILEQRPTMDCPGCTAGFVRTDFNANGDVVACNMAYESVMGNLREQSFEEIWASERADRLRAVEVPLCHHPIFQLRAEEVESAAARR